VTSDDENLPSWLTEDEQRAWRCLVRVLLRLPVALEQQLKHDADLSHFDYWVLALLSEATGGTLRLSALAADADASLSRLSHVVTRLEQRRLVQRLQCPDERRATLAKITDEGLATLVASAPGHVAEVRYRVFDLLDGNDVDALEHVCSKILTRLDNPAE